MLLKPSLFITALLEVYLKTLGFGLPFWGLGVVVPISIKPKPRESKTSTKSPFLSRPSATHSVFLKSYPQNFLGVKFIFLTGKKISKRPTEFKIFNKKSPIKWALSGGKNLKIFIKAFNLNFLIRLYISRY